MAQQKAHMWERGQEEPHSEQGASRSHMWMERAEPRRQGRVEVLRKGAGPGMALKAA